MTDLLSVSIFTGLRVPQVLCPKCLNAKNVTKNSLASLDSFNWVGLKVLDPLATGPKVFLVEVYFSNGSSLKRTANLAAEKLAPVIRANCLSGRGCFSASFRFTTSITSLVSLGEVLQQVRCKPGRFRLQLTI